MLGVKQLEKEETVLDNGLVEILSQSLDMFEEKKVEENTIDITDMFESGGTNLVVETRFQSGKGSVAETCYGFCVGVSHVIRFGKPRYRDKLLISNCFLVIARMMNKTVFKYVTTKVCTS